MNRLVSVKFDQAIGKSHDEDAPMGRKQSKRLKAAKKGLRADRKMKGRPTAKTGRKLARLAEKPFADTARQLDQAVREFEGAAEGLQVRVDKLRGALPELIEVEIQRDRLQKVKALAADGILDGLQRLAAAFQECISGGALPKSLVPVHRFARMAVDHICRGFDVQAVYRLGDVLTVTQEQKMDFDWSANPAGEQTFPVEVEIIRSGWKVGEVVLALPRVGVRQTTMSSGSGQ